VLEVKRDDLRSVPDDTEELDSRVFSVSRANRSPRDVVGAEDSWHLDGSNMYRQTFTGWTVKNALQL
jgi:hypothetical protein